MAQVDDADLRLTGPRQLAVDAAGAQLELIARVENLGVAATAGHAERWRSLSVHIGQGVDHDPYWPVVASRLTAMDAAGVDVEPLVRSLSAPALPDEQPAAALWWRLVEHVSPDIATAPVVGRTTPLVPAWQPALVGSIGPDRAEELQADPMWPALVARVDGAIRDGWEPGALLVQPPELAEAYDAGALALLWRVSMLVDPAPLDLEQLPPDPAEFEMGRPTDFDEVGQVGSPWAWWHASVAAAEPARGQTPGGEPVTGEVDKSSERVAGAQAALDAARADLAAQLEAVRTGEATHTKAMSPEVLRLRAEADRLAPYVAERDFAAADLLDAEVNVVLGPLASSDGTDTLAGEKTMTLDEARTLYTEAAAALGQVTGPDGVVRHGDVDLVAATARELDDGVTTALRTAVMQSTDDLFRAGKLSVSSVPLEETAPSQAERGAKAGLDQNLPPIDYGALEDASLSNGGIDTSLGLTAEL